MGAARVVSNTTSPETPWKGFQGGAKGEQCLEVLVTSDESSAIASSHNTVSKRNELGKTSWEEKQNKTNKKRKKNKQVNHKTETTEP